MVRFGYIGIGYADESGLSSKEFFLVGIVKRITMILIVKLVPYLEVIFGRVFIIFIFENIFLSSVVFF